MENKEKQKSNNAIKIPLSQMKANQSGKIVELRGRTGFIKKLENLGIFEGKIITKVSGQYMGGPITIRYKNTDLSIGSGMAQKIIMDVAE